MKITVELSAKDAAEALKQAMKERLEETQLVSLAQAAELLDVSKPTARLLLREWIDLGVKSPKVELHKVKQFIASRRVPV